MTEQQTAATDNALVEKLAQPLGQPVPDRIWLLDLGCGDITWCDDPDPDGEQLAAVEYVRAERIKSLLAEVARKDEALAEARRAIGDHWAPNDCYATGPLTGDPIRDLVQCPACSFITMHEALNPASKEANDG